MKYQVTKQIDFGPYTILGPSGSPADYVPLNNYAPKVGDILEGTLVTQPVNDGNGHTTTLTGLVYPIMTNGAQSTTGQTSIQFIPQDYLQVYVEPVNQNTDSNQGQNSTPRPANNSNVVPSSPSSSQSNNKKTRNIVILLAIAIIIIVIINT